MLAETDFRRFVSEAASAAFFYLNRLNWTQNVPVRPFGDRPAKIRGKSLAKACRDSLAAKVKGR
ncbi:MAG: hypothetical protein BHW57_04865 [Azospirillum sp. 47_25]|nr:MAG: hypothetical protein BHW57_04865 [Azospirillum sp. 47_25]